MQSHRIAILASVVFILVVNAAEVAAQRCDRACLAQVLDGYLEAVVAHDPSGAPLANSFRYTENAIAVLPGEGLWKTATALGPVQRRYLDPMSGQAAFFGLIEEGAGSAIATLRLKIMDRSITEAELVIGRPSMGVFNREGLIENQPPPGPVAAQARTSREDLLAAAMSYFEGVHTKDGSIIRAHPGCPRIENGLMLAGRRPAAERQPQLADCTAGMERNTQIAAVVSRRFPVVDEESGAVLGMAVFLRPPNARRPDGSALGRNLLTEIFTIENGRIRSIHAAMHYLDEGVPAPGW